MDKTAVEPEVHKSPGYRVGVLVAEDEALLRAETVRALSDAGFAAFEAADADEAIAVLAGRDDLGALVTDIVMPAGAVNGYQLARMVAARWPQVGIVVASGLDRPGPADLQQGARFLSKPVREQDVVAAVSSLATERAGGV